jgi:anaerobic selenocysteine-containing dehydrogenase
MGVIGSSRGSLEPSSPHLLSEPAIVAGLARAVLGPKRPIDWEDYTANYDLIRDKIEAVVPGFPAYNDRVRSGTFYLPNPPRDERKFETPDGKAHFIAHALSHVELAPGQYLLTTVRSHDQFNTSVYGLDDRYRGIYNGRRVIFLNEEDMQEAGLMGGHLVDITSHFRGQTRTAQRFMVAPYPIRRRCAATYFPEANVLVPLDSVADDSNCPASKSVPISLALSAVQGRLDVSDLDPLSGHGHKKADGA